MFYKIALILIFFICWSLKVFGEEDAAGMEEMFVHPFLAHQALPDPPSEVSLRITPFQQRNGAVTSQDLGVHVEAGLIPGFGLHLRNDAAKSELSTDIMLMYALLEDEALSRGVSVFGQLTIPTGPIETNTYEGMFGLAARATVLDLAVIDANVEINPKDEMAEYESAFVFKGTNIIYPVVEIRGEISKDETTAYSLLGLKFRIAKETAWGIGYQIPLTAFREYDAQLLGTLGMAF